MLLFVDFVGKVTIFFRNACNFSALFFNFMHFTVRVHPGAAGEVTGLLCVVRAARGRRPKRGFLACVCMRERVTVTPEENFIIIIRYYIGVPFSVS